MACAFSRYKKDLFLQVWSRRFVLHLCVFHDDIVYSAYHLTLTQACLCQYGKTEHYKKILLYSIIFGNNPEKCCCIVRQANNWFGSKALCVCLPESFILENSRAATTNSTPWPKCILKTCICLNSAHLPRCTQLLLTHFYCATELFW